MDCKCRISPSLAQAAEADASSQLRNDQAKLVELQDRIERLDKSLEKLSAAGKMSRARGVERVSLGTVSRVRKCRFGSGLL